MLIILWLSRSCATEFSATATVSPGTKRCTTSRVTGNRSAVRRSPSDLLAARIAGRPTRSKKPISSLHVRVVVIGRRYERLLDGPGRRPPQQVERGARLIVGARSARAAERLLPDDGAGRLVVDIEVARGEPQPVLCLQHCLPVVGDDRSRQRVLRAVVDDIEHLLVVGVGIHVYRQDGSEVLGGERLV